MHVAKAISDIFISLTLSPTGQSLGLVWDLQSSHVLSRRLFTHLPLAPVYVSIIVFFFVISRQLPIFLYLITAVLKT